LLARGERFQFFALSGNFHFLLPDLFGLAFERLVIASEGTRGHENHRSKQTYLPKTKLHRR